MDKIKKVSRKREQKAAKEIGGAAHAGSGCFWSKKSDFSNTTFQIEEKFTYAPSYSLKLTKLLKIEKEAKEVNKLPVFRFGFILDKSYDYVILRKKDCVFDPKVIQVEAYSKNKSLTLNNNMLQSIYLASKTPILMSIEIQEGAYILIKWDDFVLLYPKIARGEDISSPIQRYVN